MQKPQLLSSLRFLRARIMTAIRHWRRLSTQRTQRTRPLLLASALPQICPLHSPLEIVGIKRAGLRSRLHHCSPFSLATSRERTISHLFHSSREKLFPAPATTDKEMIRRIESI